MKKLFLLQLLLFLLFIPAAVSADEMTWQEWLIQGETHFHNGLEQNEENLHQAVRDYKNALEAGAPRDWRIFYNLGNLMYMAGYKGEAALNYQKALYLNPGKEPSRQNWEFITTHDRTSGIGKSPIDSLIYASLYLLGYKASLYGGLFVFFFSWLILITNIFIKRKNLALTAYFLLGISLWNTGLCGIWHYRAEKTGVLTRIEPELRLGDSQAYGLIESEALKEGRIFTLIENRDGWFRIRLEDKTEGWIEETEGKMLLQKM